VTLAPPPPPHHPPSSLILIDSSPSPSPFSTIFYSAMYAIFLVTFSLLHNILRSKYIARGCVIIWIDVNISVPEFIDPVSGKTSQIRSFCMTENERFGLVFPFTGSKNSGNKKDKTEGWS
jgi:hypothetical protein